MQWHEIFWTVVGIASAYPIGYGLMLLGAWSERRRLAAMERWERMQFNATRHTEERRNA